MASGDHKHDHAHDHAQDHAHAHDHRRAHDHAHAHLHEGQAHFDHVHFGHVHADHVHVDHVLADHAGDPAWRPAPAPENALSLLRMSAGQRLAGAGALCALLWLGVVWALT
jgi:hypothetical protein